MASSDIKKIRERILSTMKKIGKKPISKKELEIKCRFKKNEKSPFYIALEDLLKEGVLLGTRRGIILCEAYGMFRATVTRLNRTFGFIKREDDDSEVFVPGKFFCGAMPGDLVIAKLIPSRTSSPEGEIIDIIENNFSRFSGTIRIEENRVFIQPDTLSKGYIRVITDENWMEKYRDGDKALAEVVQRGKSHNDHKAKVICNFGSSEDAVNCANSVLAVNGIIPEFPNNVQNDAKKIAFAGLSEHDFNNRLDLRSEAIFTIDSAESKDLDDAISISKEGRNYRLGVHIADVTHYVKANSPLDKEALRRGTSVYYANKVVPMLPKELSNGICSLNPCEDRLAFSCLMKISADGDLLEYKFKKTVICSRVKGIYSEINQILRGEESSEIAEKYAGVREKIAIMKELADILTSRKIKRGAPLLETSESKLIIGEDDRCVDVKPRERGEGMSEVIIEEFMLMANQAAATIATKRNIPFVYRIHENPAEEKVSNLRRVLEKLNLPCPHFSDIKPAHLSSILESARELPIFPVLNVIVLRTMAKAKYSNEPIGHFGLALADYSHFTSPIRRYPDLAIHRILSDMVAGYDHKWLTSRYSGFVVNASQHSTAAEINAMTVERQCDDCYKAEYMKNHIGESFEGVISSVTDFGFYVELPNTVEGLVHVNTLPDGNYSFDDVFCLEEEYSKAKYKVGDKVRVLCTGANVPSGNIDFELEEKLV